MTGERSGKGGKLCFADFDTAEPHLIFYKNNDRRAQRQRRKAMLCGL